MSRMQSVDALEGVAVVLTGATAGIGRATALLLADRADHLILHGLEPESEAADVLAEVRAQMRPDTRLDYVAADFGDPGQVAQLARDIRLVTDRVDIFINNAGRPGPPTRMLTRAGDEVTFQTNYLAPVRLTGELIDHIAGRSRGSRGRIINIASATHLSATLHLDDLSLARHGYTPSDAYAHSKLALVTWSCWLAAHRPSPLLDVVSMHPGVISTTLLHAMFSIGGDRPERAAGNILHVVSLTGDNGAYYDERMLAAPNPEATDPATQDRLHDITSRHIGER